MADKKRTNEDQIFDQLNKAYKRNNTKSFVTQNDYYKYAKMMGSFYAKNFNGQKFVNISGKHLRAYIEEMKQKGLAPTTMRARLSGIRFYYEIMGGKNRLPDNESLGLDKRRLGKEDRAWLKEEIAGGLVLSQKHGRIDVYFSIKLGATFGLRRIECCRIRLDCIERALRYDELTVKGKGGQRRAIPVVTKEQKELLIELYNFAKKKRFSAITSPLKEIDFETIGLLLGLFLMIGGISEQGVIAAAADLLAKAGGGNVFFLYTVVVWASVLISAFIDNIPYVATMIPVIAGLAGALNIDPTILYFGLLSGATLGGNCTPIGASANITGIGILRKEGYTVKNSDFFKIGIPFTLAAIVPAYIYLWIMYGV